LTSLFYNEVRCLKRLKHPNIIKLKGFSEKATAEKPSGNNVEVMYMALDYAENGEIFDYISETGRFGERVARFYYHQLISALEYMHERGYYHRDIKPENILLDEEFNLKLADFGFTTKSETSQSRKGTFGYMAPEVLAKNEYQCYQADLFASAIILFILLSQHPPFVRAEEEDRYYRKIIAGNWDKFWRIYHDEPFSEDFKDLFMQMVDPDPDVRPTLQEIKDHPWFNGPVATHEEIKTEFLKRQAQLLLTRQKGLNRVKRTKFEPSEDDDNADAETLPSEKDILKAQKEVRKKEVKKKYTRFFDVKDGDELIDAVIEMAEKNNYSYEKSKDFFRVILTINNSDGNANITVNVLKSPDDNNRCLEFVFTDGDKSVFSEAFYKCKKFCKRKFC
jgi:serine/threonine protein kinase